MFELKMSDAFNTLEYKNGRDIDTGELVDASGNWWATFNNKQAAMHASIAINSHDSHVEQIDKLTKENEVLKGNIKSLAGEFDKMISCKVSCDGMLIVSVENYNNTVNKINQALAATESSDEG